MIKFCHNIKYKYDLYLLYINHDEFEEYVISQVDADMNEDWGYNYY